MAPPTPYRLEPEPMRFSLIVNGEVFEGDHFIEIINALRERGHDNGVLTRAALAVMTKARGAVLDTELEP